MPDTPDLEALLCAWVTTTLGQPCSTETPAKLTNLPLHRCTLVVGTDRAPGLGQVAVDFDTFAANKPAAAEAANALKDALTYQLPGTVLAGAAFGPLLTPPWPSWRPWDNTNVRRYGATYLLVVHVMTTA